MHMHIYVMTGVSGYIHTKMYSFISQMCAPICVYIHVYALHTYIHENTCIHPSMSSYIHPYLNGNMHACIDACLATYTHTHIFTCLHTYKHIYIPNTHKQPLMLAYKHAYIHTYIKFIHLSVET